MTEMTPLDLAQTAMQAAPEDDAARLAFYDRLADSELLVLLTAEARDNMATPQIFETSSGSFVLAFDREERLTAFSGAVSPYLALSGRSLARLLEGQGVGLGLNLGAERGEILLPPESLAWLSETLSEAPAAVETGISALLPPGDLPQPLLTALDAKLATAGGLADAAYLAAVETEAGGRGHLLGFVGAPHPAQAALAAAVNEALIFSGLDAGVLDVGFFAAEDPFVVRLESVALKFDLPAPEVTVAPAAPGSDPDKPPRLR